MNGANPNPTPAPSASSNSPHKPPRPVQPGQSAQPSHPLRTRRKPPANPLLSRRPPKPIPRPAKPGDAPPLPASTPNNALKTARPPAKSLPPSVPQPRAEAFTKRPPSPEPQGELSIVPIVVTKRDLLMGLRHHIARLQSKTAVDVRDESVFIRPVRLHRKDPAARPLDNDSEPLDPEAQAKELLQEKERDRLEAIKLENKRIREENQKFIAPGLSSSKKNLLTSKRKTEQVYRPNDTPEERKKSQLRYEEAFPWCIEDDENQHTWTGAFEQTLSDCHLLFVPDDGRGGFRVVPVEKYYRFKEQGKKQQVDPDKANDLMTKKSKEPRFIMLKRLELEQKKLVNQPRLPRGGRTRAARDNDDGEGLFGNPDVQEGVDEVDFDNDELFDDDDQDPIFEGGEEDDTKQAMDRIKKEQLGANFFDLLDENEVEAQEEQRAKQELFRKKAEKKIRKGLIKREKNFIYEDDSDDSNPYSSSSEEEDSSQEGDGEDKSPEKAKVPPPGTTGDTTPSGRKKNADGPAAKPGVKRGYDLELSEASGNESSRKKKAKLNANLKRPGSPDMSGASGNESSRKKQKMAAGVKSVANRKLSALRGGAGSGSESESGKRVSGQPSSSKPTPAGSRAQSPTGGASRSASPAVPDANFPSQSELRAAIPPEGIPLGALVAKFRGRVQGPLIKPFTSLVRSIAHHDKATNLVMIAKPKE